MMQARSEFTADLACEGGGGRQADFTWRRYWYTVSLLP